MSRLSWGDSGKRYFETGLDRGVLYVGANPGVAWSGLVSVEENSSGGEEKSYYVDGIMYLNRATPEDFKATIKAYMYPDEFMHCDGSAFFYGLQITGQRRIPFGLSYRTKIGNDVDGADHGYKIHIVYNALALPTSRQYQSSDDSISPTMFSWNISARPTVLSGYKPTAHFVIDSRTTFPVTLTNMENILYGDESNPPRLPTADEMLTVFAQYTDFIVVDNGDGTFTVTGPDEFVSMTSDTTFAITWPAIVTNEDGTYTITSV